MSEISLRDTIATAVLQGFLEAKYNLFDYEERAFMSYEQADAMLAERENFKPDKRSW